MGLLARTRQAFRTFGALARAATTLLASGTLYQSAGSGYRFRGWSAPTYGPTASIVLAGDTLRNRSRAEARNNAWARNLLLTLTTNIAGTGFTPHPLFGSGDTGSAAEASARWVRDARMKFRRWAHGADIDGRNFDDAMWTAVYGMVEAGETFLLRVQGESAGVPLQLRVVEAEMVPLWKNETLENGHEIRAGIEFDVQDQVVAYWMFPSHPGEFTLRRPIMSVDLVRIDAANVIHLFRRTRPGQVRGEPWLAPVILRLHDLGGYADAEVVRKKGAANFLFKIEAPDPNNVSQAIGKLHDDNAEKGEVDVKPGTTVVTAVGETFDIVSPTDVGPNFAAFFVQILREVCAGPGVPYALATGDMSQETYTSHRAALLEFWRRCDAVQCNVLVPCLRRLWAWWLEDAVASGVVVAARFTAWREDYLDCDWMPPKRDWIDPQKEVGATGDALELGITSKTRVCAALGEDYADILRERIAEAVMEREAARAAGVELPTAQPRPARPVTPDEPRPMPRTGTDG